MKILSFFKKKKVEEVKEEIKSPIKTKVEFYYDNVLNIFLILFGKLKIILIDINIMRALNLVQMSISNNLFFITGPHCTRLKLEFGLIKIPSLGSPTFWRLSIICNKRCSASSKLMPKCFAMSSNWYIGSPSSV